MLLGADFLLGSSRIRTTSKSKLLFELDAYTSKRGCHQPQEPPKRSLAIARLFFPGLVLVIEPQPQWAPVYLEPTVDGCEILHHLIDGLSPFLIGFQPRWCRMSSISTLAFLLLSIGFPWDFHRFSMGFPWDFHGMSMGFPWDFHGIAISFRRSTTTFDDGRRVIRRPTVPTIGSPSWLRCPKSPWPARRSLGPKRSWTNENWGSS